MKRTNRKFGFTIVELLTVMSIIAILIGLLAPALNLVRDIATETKQKAQFHAIAVALDIYKGEMEEYPESSYNVTGGLETVGAHHLAEALIGRDFLGFDTWSTWDAKADESNAATVYPDQSKTPAAIEASLQRRKGPYLNPENIEAFQILQLYATTTGLYPGNITSAGVINSNVSAPVLTDSFRSIKTALPNGKSVKAGSPILYYKANSESTEFPLNATTSIVTGGTNGTDQSIFNSTDNETLIELGTMKNQTVLHHFDLAYTNSATDNGRRIFYDAITNPKITGIDRPYNQSSYILISAGKDGIFGTSDDIFNFND